MSESFGEALRRLRGDISLRQLAVKVNYSYGYLSELERGVKKPTMSVAGKCDQALGGNGQLTALVCAVGLDYIPEQVDSRNDGAEVVPIKELAMTADESARFIRRAGLSANAELVEQLSEEVRALAFDFVRRPPYSVFSPIATLRRDIFAILDSHMRPRYLTDLYLIGGKASALLAHACADLGQPVIAEAHARTAWLCADLAGSNELRAYVKWIQSNIAYWGKDFRRAAEFAQAGQEYATQGSSRLRLTSQEARSWAAIGNGPAVQDALQAARTERDGLPLQPIEDGVLWFNPGKAAYYASEAFLALGGEDNARQALSEASEAIELLRAEDDPCAELVAAAELDHVSAHLALTDANAVQGALPSILDLPTERRTVPVVARVGKIGEGLETEQFAGSAVAADLRERIALFMAYPAMRELST
jgi:transcriptional regulator with XRE-family HTH domain